MPETKRRDKYGDRGRMGSCIQTMHKRHAKNLGIQESKAECMTIFSSLKINDQLRFSENKREQSQRSEAEVTKSLHAHDKHTQKKEKRLEETKNQTEGLGD